MYQINVIPCNAGLGSKRQMAKSRSADDMEVVLGKAEELESAQKMPVEPVKIKITARDSSENHLNMIANRAKNVQRKNKKMKSRLFVKGPEGAGRDILLHDIFTGYLNLSRPVDFVIFDEDKTSILAGSI